MTLTGIIWDEQHKSAGRESQHSFETFALIPKEILVIFDRA